jgi:PAS domain S-box-containing protein
MRERPGMQSSEQALRESEEKFRTLAETTDSAIFVWREALLYVNPAACAISG